MRAGHAVVVGGSIAGLAAARVLIAFFERVTVIDRDALPVGVDDRPGVPQGRHVHALLARGLNELEGLFPGFEERLRAGGAVEIDFGLDFAALRPLGWSPRVSVGMKLLFASRALIEATIRRLFGEISDATILDRTTVTGLILAAEHDRVIGVRIRSADTAQPREIAADLVIDASGRGSKAPEWLRDVGREPPNETTVDALAGYSTRWFTAPDAARWPREWWWKGIWIDPRIPDDLRAAVLFPVEHDRWIVTLAGLGGQYPPTDEQGFHDALDALRSPILAEAVRLGTPISPVYGSRAMANRFRHYESWQDRLAGFLAIADSVCAFNPVYGQGMTAAAICAHVLEDALRTHGGASAELPASFFRAQARAERTLWDLATGADLMVPQTIGERPVAAKFSVPYFKALMEASLDDLVVLRRFVEVVQLTRSPTTLFAPSILARVAIASLTRRLARSRSPREIRPLPL